MNAHDELIDHLERTTPLGRAQAARVVSDVLADFDEIAEEFVRRRHRELQREGLRNEDAFLRIASDLEAWRLRAPALSPRQLRRIVYG